MLVIPVIKRINIKSSLIDDDKENIYKGIVIYDNNIKHTTSEKIRISGSVTNNKTYYLKNKNNVKIIKFKQNAYFDENNDIVNVCNIKSNIYYVNCKLHFVKKRD